MNNWFHDRNLRTLEECGESDNQVLVVKLRETVFLPCALGSLERNEAIAILETCIAKLPLELKKILAMHYYENLQLVEIADCFGVTEGELDQIRAETLGLLQTMLATQIGLPHGSRGE